MQTINHDVNDDVFELWEELFKSLGPPKYKILEAAIQAYAALPKEARSALKLEDENDRKVVLARIRELNLSAAKGKRA